MFANRIIKATNLLLSAGTLLLGLLVSPCPTVTACDADDHNVHKELRFLDESDMGNG